MRKDCSLDKLDKSPWKWSKRNGRRKGQPEEVADKIGEFVKHNGSIVRWERNRVKSSSPTTQHKRNRGNADLADYVDAFDITQYCLSFDLSLARGLDYYTGLIYEAVTAASAPPENATELKAKQRRRRIGICRCRVHRCWWPLRQFSGYVLQR